MKFTDRSENAVKFSLIGGSVILNRYDFEKKTDCKYDASFGKPIDEIDFASLSDDDLWAYIYGECLVNGRLSSELNGFGSVQIPRDKTAFLEKRCRVINCNDCDRKNTERCYKADTTASGKKE